MPERWRSPAARQLVKAVRKAGGTVERAGTGRLRITANERSVTIQEPGGDTRREGPLADAAAHAPENRIHP